MPTNPKPLRKQRNPKPPPAEYQFKPGVSGNPGGRPKLLRDAYKEKLAEVDSKTGKTNAQLVADAMVRKAKSGGETAAKELRQATEGDLLEQTVTTVTVTADELAQAKKDAEAWEKERFGDVAEAAAEAAAEAPKEDGTK